MPLDYSGQNLRGRSFKGQDLSGANFSGADIRGANFTGAMLQNANFSHAKAGLKKRRVIGLVIFSCFLSSLAALVSSLAAIVISTNFEPNFFISRDGIILTFLIILSFINIQRGISAFVIVLSIILTVTSAIAVILSVLEQGQVTVALVLGVIGSIVETIVSAATTGGAVSVIGFKGVVSITAATLFGIVTAIKIFESQINTIGVIDLFINGIAITLGIGQGAYIVKKALAGDEKYGIIRNVSVAFAATGGTSFRNTNLTDANFTGAILKNTDFRNAILTRTCFHKTKKLDLARPGVSYLLHKQIRQLLVAGQVQDKNFDGENLRGVNFQGINLVDASFIGADLREANLQDTDLSRAILKETQLNGTDLTGATLTGAYIEDWGITSDTKLNGVRCEYVYMRLPTKENPDPWRKPDNREEVFEDGEFGDFIKPIVDTLDLYHNQGIDPRAIAISFKQLAENNPDAELRIVGMEVKGEDKFLLRAKTASYIDKSELSAEYFETYNYLKSLPPSEQIKHFLTELKVKDTQINYQQNHIYRLENMITTALGRPNIQTENYNNYGDTIMSEISKKINNDLKGAQFAGGLVNADTVNTEQIGGDIINYGQEKSLLKHKQKLMTLQSKLF
ncbi:MAG: pentapeptide repeat-containing protein [Cyanobacteria bacterium P01_A01_bin.80]